MCLSGIPIIEPEGRASEKNISAAALVFSA